MGGLINFLVIQFLIGILVWYYSTDVAYCIIDGVPEFNGYYKGVETQYNKVGGSLSTTLDFFGIQAARRQIFRNLYIGLIDNTQIWGLKFNGKVYMKSSFNVSVGESPPPIGWLNAKNEPLPYVKVSCMGYLANSANLNPPRTNIEIMMNHPVTTGLLLFITYYAYRLWETRTDVGAVSFSYSAFMVDKQYWRAITASISHFDIMHYAFNAMSLYQFGFLESVYGSVVYGYLSFALIFITIFICAGISYFMMTRMNRADMSSQQSVGYSCVLFAWMVAASIRMPSFCPLFFMPTLCFDTYTIPFPFTTGLPINIGPIILLFITKLIIPRSSFVGHLSGIIIGYPLAWNWLNWFTPPIYTSLFALFTLYHHQLWHWKLPARDNRDALIEFVNTSELRKFRVLQTSGILVILISSLLTIFVVESWPQLIPRAVFAYLIVFAWQARSCLWHTDERLIASYCVYAMMLALFGGLIATAYDVCNLSALIGSWSLLQTAGVPPNYLSTALLSWLALIVLELVFCIAVVTCLHDVSTASYWLMNIRMDLASFKADVSSLRLQTVVASLLPSEAGGGSGVNTRVAFSGVGHRLQANMESRQSLLHSHVVSDGDLYHQQQHQQAMVEGVNRGESPSPVLALHVKPIKKPVTIQV